jgi:hypothetical protein
MDKKMVIKKEDIGMNESLKIQGRLGLNNKGEPYKSFNGKQTLEQARNFAMALLVAVNKAEQEGLNEIDIVFGLSENNDNDNNFLMVGYH